VLNRSLVVCGVRRDFGEKEEEKGGGGWCFHFGLFITGSVFNTSLSREKMQSPRSS